MKKIAYITVILCLLLACGPRKEYKEALLRAEAIMDDHPDSALHLLEQMKDTMQHAGKADRMFYELLLTDAQNKSYVDFATDSIMKEVVRYYDRHGSANERMRAHYLLGCTYRDMGEAPMALQCYQDAVESADTTKNDCDYKLLSKVYGQAGKLFYQQDLAQHQVSMVHDAVKYSLLAGDTLSAMFNYEQLCGTYENMGRNDSALLVADSLISWFSNHQLPKDAAITQGRAAVILIKQAQFEKAMKYMIGYEKCSGLFDPNGNIAKGREVYYYLKGLAYLHETHLDSAEYYFRKELRDGKDFNNQNAGAKGLASLYEKTHIPDSAAKYYRYAYEMNDSLYVQMATEQVEHTQSIYNYTRNQEIARKRSEEARRERIRFHLVVTVFVVSVSLLSLLIYGLYREGRKRLARYEQTMSELRLLRKEKEALGKHALEYEQLIGQKEKEIKNLKARMGKYGKLAYFKTAVAERALKGSPTYQAMAVKATKGQLLTEEDKQTIKVIVAEYLPGFDDFMESNSSWLSSNEYNICILLRLHFKAVEVSGMLGLSKSMVSQTSRDVMDRVFKEQGSSKELSNRLKRIY